LLLQCTIPDPLSEPRASSTLWVPARLGAAIANATIAAFLVVGWLPDWNAVTPDRLAQEVPGYIDAKTSEPVDGQWAGTSPRLVIAKAAPGAVNAPIPLGISLVNADNVDAVVLTSLPAGSNITNGRPSATSGWHLFAYELANATIRPAQDFVGGADVNRRLAERGK